MGGGQMGAPLVNRPGAQVVGPTGVHASNFNQMVPQGGPPRPTGPGGPGPPPGPPPPAGMGYPGGAVAGLPLAILVDAWNRPFLPVAQGGCPPVGDEIRRKPAREGAARWRGFPGFE